MLSLGVGLTSVPVLARRGPAYDPDALAFFARLTNPPTDARKKLYSDLIASLKTAGVWAKLDALYILAAADAQAARQNLVANAYNLTAIGSPTFTVDRGYAGDGSGAYLATGFNPSTAVSPKYTLDSASAGVWSRTSALTAGTEIGARTNSTTAQLVLTTRESGDAAASRLNTGSLTGYSSTDGSGDFILTRNDAVNITPYKNATLVGTLARASTAVPTSPITILALNTGGTIGSFSSKQHAAAHIGGGFSQSDATAFFAARAAYLTAIGAYP